VISSSNLECVARCRRAATLPHADRANEYATKGTAIHAFLADVPVVGLDAALAKVPKEHRAAVSVIDVSQLPACQPDAYSVEVGFAYDFKKDTGRELLRGGRDYSTIRESEIGGTPDVIGLGSDFAIVFDYKTGWGHELSPARDNLQLKSYALMVARTYGRTRVSAVIIRIKDDGTIWHDRADFDEYALDEIASQIMTLMQDARAFKADGTKSGYVIGAHCRRCPALPFCPAALGMANSMIAAPGEAYALPVPPLLEISPDITKEGIAAMLTVEVFPDVWARIKLAKELLKVVEDGARMFASMKPVPIGDGKFVGPHVTPKRFLDGGVTHKVLMEVCGQDVADRAVTMETSQSAVEESIREFAKQSGMTISGLKKQIVDEVTARGGVKVTSKTTVGEFRPKGEKADE
jgi:hypothetical protein